MKNGNSAQPRYAMNSMNDVSNLVSSVGGNFLHVLATMWAR